MKILMVCLGNICRSPLAEGIMKNKVKEHGLTWEVDSAGTGSWHIGQKPDPRSIAIAHKYGIDINDQRARQFKPSDLSEFDLILTMDSDNYRNVIRFANEKQQSKVHLILNLLHPGKNQNVPDPYFNGGFEEVFGLLDAACNKIIEKYR